MTDTAMNSLRYVDETDKTFGLAGMVISLLAWDGEEQLSTMNLDAAPEEAIRMTPDFYICPVASAKAVWSHKLRRFQLSAAMLVGNVICRKMIHQRLISIPGDVDTDLRRAIVDEGADLCQLEPEEAINVYSQAITHCRRLFAHPAVARTAHNISQAIASRRTLSSAEILELLAPLSSL